MDIDIEININEFIFLLRKCQIEKLFQMLTVIYVYYRMSVYKKEAIPTRVNGFSQYSHVRIRRQQLQSKVRIIIDGYIIEHNNIDLH